MNRIVLAVTLAICVFAPASSYPAEQPNILWIIGEDASPHLSCYGETAIDTPHLDKLAEQGIRFTNAYVTSLGKKNSAELYLQAISQLAHIGSPISQPLDFVGCFPDAGRTTPIQHLQHTWSSPCIPGSSIF